MELGFHLWVYCQLEQRAMAGAPLEEVYVKLVDERLPTIAADVAAAGFDSLETMASILMTPAQREAHLTALGAAGVALSGFSDGGAYWDPAQRAEFVDRLEPLCAWAGSHGAQHLGLSAAPVAGREKTAADWDEQAETWRQINTAARRHGVVPNLHTYARDAADDYREVRELLERLDPAELVLGPDLDWLAQGGGQAVEFIDRFGGRMGFCHVRDRTADRGWAEAIGDGIEDFAAIGAALRRAGYAGPVVFEPAFADWAPTRPLAETLKLSAAHLRQTLGA